ncbi:MAG: enoyl-CoA hydratase-related protein, partial [Paraglaciecola sp.]|uniref:enoyl-CoA hydratase-related protein n=1 Tax=Paraglaciecola sp. TaxID=1920173 RepID=UPI00329770FE
MIYEGNSLSVNLLQDGIAELVFDAQGSVNKFDQQTVAEFNNATQALTANGDVKGLIVRSAKSTFIVGADITEFTGLFDMPDKEVLTWVAKTSHVFDRFEDLPFPTIAAVNGFALGGGCEMTLACDFRVADTTASLGLPEVKLGIMPGFGGTVRLPRLIGSDNALEWMTTGRDHKAAKALAEGALDAVVAPEKLVDAAISMLKDAIAGEFDWHARRTEKTSPLKLNKNEAMMSFSTAK